MIGMIALAGIVVRNSVVLIDFIHGAREEGYDLLEAIIRSTAVRSRPIFLTAATTFLGNWVITLDPIFSGLVWAVIFGIVASTLFTLLVIPIVYALAFGKIANGQLVAKTSLEPCIDLAQRSSEIAPLLEEEKETRRQSSVSGELFSGRSPRNFAAAFSTTHKSQQAFPSSAETGLILTELIQQALDSSPDIESALARLNRADAAWPEPEPNFSPG